MPFLSAIDWWLSLMALDTECTLSIEKEHKICFCGVHAVTGYTGNRLTIAGIHGLFSHGVGDCMLGLMTF